jgi:hypothetical protein
MIISSEFTSFPQRVMTGVDLESAKNPDGTIRTDAEIRAAVNRLWAFENENAKVFQLESGSLSQYVEATDMAIQHLAAQTRTPPHYLLAKLINVSGDALVAAETGLEHRAKRKHLDFADSWEEAMRIAFAWRAIARQGWAGADEDKWRSELDEAETIWMSPASQDPVVLAQSLTMKQAIGVPQEQLWEEAGYTPQKIKRMKKLRDEELKRQAELAQIAPAPGQDPNAPQLTLSPGANGTVVGGLPAPPPEPAQNGGVKANA